MKTKFRATLILSLITPLLLILVVFLMGGGHGYYEPGIILFPTALISFSILGRLSIPFVILGILQFPVYGLLVDNSKNKTRTSIIVLLFHIVLVLTTFFTVKNL